MRRAIAAAALITLLAGCGQRGPLYLPRGPEAAGRATLPEVLLPTTPSNPALPASDDAPPGRSGTGTANPSGTP